jgi:spore coat polysaccharide biosynthesis predicted glycosyltransferase SpsG/GNAT superfamily N-acetyltransferase
MQVLLSCDGGGSLGVGHVMRSLALAEAAVRAGHRVLVAGHFEGSWLATQLLAAPVEVARISPWAGGDPRRSLNDIVARLHPDVLHVDSYTAPDHLGAMVSSPGASHRVLSNIEDGAYGRRPADVVLDPTFGAELFARPQDGSTWLLRGSRYSPVRQRVIDARVAVSREINDGVAGADAPAGQRAQSARSVLVVMGGTDPVGLAPAAIALLAHTGLDLAVTAIAVGGNAERVRTAARGTRLSVKVLAPVDDLAGLMSGHDLVISAAGTSIWELCCIGVPAAVAWAVDNQREGYERVVSAGAAIGLGGPALGANEGAVGSLRAALTDSQVRARLASAGQRIVDGLGAWRVVRMWEQALSTGPLPPVDSSALVARAATSADSRQLWAWRNDPVTRAGSRSRDEVAWEDHLRWLAAGLARTDRILLVVEDAVGPVGTVRWDLQGERQWEVSITVAPQRRGQNLARPLLREGEVALSAATAASGTAVEAYLGVVKVDNPSSMRLFQTSGYLPDLPPDPAGFMRFRKDAQVA